MLKPFISCCSICGCLSGFAITLSLALKYGLYQELDNSNSQETTNLYFIGVLLSGGFLGCCSFGLLTYGVGLIDRLSSCCQSLFKKFNCCRDLFSEDNKQQHDLEVGKLQQSYADLLEQVRIIQNSVSDCDARISNLEIAQKTFVSSIRVRPPIKQKTELEEKEEGEIKQTKEIQHQVKFFKKSSRHIIAESPKKKDKKVKAKPPKRTPTKKV